MKSERYEMRMAPSLMEAIDQRRGQLSRAAWITGVLERALGGESGSAVVRTSRRNSDGPRPEDATPEELVGVGNVREQVASLGTPLPKIAPRRQPR